MAKNPPKKKITPKRAIFVKEYVIDFNGARAVREAFPKERNPRQKAYYLLTLDYIQAVIQKEIEKRALRTERTADEVINLLWKMGDYSLEDYFDISEEGEITAKRFDQLKPGAAKLINGIKYSKHALKGKKGAKTFLSISDIEYKMPNRDKIVELLMRHYGLFKKDNEQGGISEVMLAVIMGALPVEDAENVKKALIVFAKGKK